MENEYSALTDLLNRYGRSSEAEAPKRIADATSRLGNRFTELLAAVAEGADGTGQVTATVKMSGRIESVHISPQAIRNLRGPALDQACLEAILAARKAGAAAFATQLEDLTGQRVHLEP